MVSKCERKRKIINNRQPLLFNNLSRNLSQLSPLLNQLKQNNISNDTKIQLKQKINEIQQKMNQQYNIKGNFKLLLNDTECTFNPILSAMANEPQLKRFLKEELQVSTFNDLRKEIRKLNNKQVIKLIRNHEKVNKPVPISTTAPPPPPPPPGMAPPPPPPPGMTLVPPPQPRFKKVEPEIKLPKFKEYNQLKNEKTNQSDINILFNTFQLEIENMKKPLEKLNNSDPEKYFKERKQQLLKPGIADKKVLYDELNKIFYKTVENKNEFDQILKTEYQRKIGNNKSLLTILQKKKDDKFLEMLKDYISKQEGHDLLKTYLDNLKLIKEKQAQRTIDNEKQNFENKQEANKIKQLGNRKYLFLNIMKEKTFFTKPPPYEIRNKAQNITKEVIQKKINNLSKKNKVVDFNKKIKIIDIIIILGNLTKIIKNINETSNNYKIYKQFYKYIETTKGLSYVSKVIQEIEKMMKTDKNFEELINGLSKENVKHLINTNIETLEGKLPNSNTNKKNTVINQILKEGNLIDFINNLNNNNIITKFNKCIENKNVADYVLYITNKMVEDSKKSKVELPEYNIKNNNKNKTEVEKLLKEISNKTLLREVIETYYDVLKDIKEDDKLNTYLSKQKGFNSVRNFINSQKKM